MPATRSVRKSLNKAYLKVKPQWAAVEWFREKVGLLIERSVLTISTISTNQLRSTLTIASFETQIDLLVCRLYELSYAEVLVVGGEFGMSEETYRGS